MKHGPRLEVERIDAIAELERAGIQFESIGNDEVRLKCPVHSDNSPSVNLNIVKNLWLCHAAGCQGRGDIVSLLALHLGVQRGTIIIDLSSRYDLDAAKVINPESIEKFHTLIWDEPNALAELSKRGIGAAEIREARLGFWQGRITIPIKDAQHNFVNVRRYRPGAPGPEKFKNTPGYGKALIYQPDQLNYPAILICGGELKALAAKRFVNELNVGAISVSAGEGSWDVKWNPLLKDKTVYICMDVDDAGVKASDVIARVLHKTTIVKICRLPLDKAKYPKGDLNDWVGQENATTKDFKALLDSASEFLPREASAGAIPNEIHSIQISQIQRDNSMVRRRVRFPGIISAADDKTYRVPRSLTVTCDKKQKSCPICPIFTLDFDPDQKTTVEIPCLADQIIAMMGTSKKGRVELALEAIGVPKCRSLQVDEHDYYALTDARLSPEVSITGGATEDSGDSQTHVAACIIDKKIELNTKYEFEGVVYASPKNSVTTVLVTDAVVAVDNLDSYEPKDLAELTCFQPLGWSCNQIASKVRDISDFLSQEVTRIYHRGPLHLLLDLTFHSCLMFSYNKQVVPGWLNTLVLGDSAQGKSQVSTSLRDYYGLGTIVDCKNASPAGILGGLQQMHNSQWFISWGLLPRHDRRLVMLEEMKGLDTEFIGRLTGMRSTGIVELPKIEHKRALARTRICFISNPRNGRLEDYRYGIDAATELFGSPEDIRRLDLALFLSSSQIQEHSLFEEQEITHVGTYAADLCRKLILFAWTRQADQIQFEAEAVEAIKVETKKLLKLYHDSIPLFDSGAGTLKLARLSVAIAARTFSVSDDLTSIVVRAGHVEFISKFIQYCYGDSVCGFSVYCQQKRSQETLRDARKVTDLIMNLPDPRGFVSVILDTESHASLEEFQLFCSLPSRDEAMAFRSALFLGRCFEKRGRFYCKTPAFTTLLKRLRNIQTDVVRGEEF